MKKITNKIKKETSQQPQPAMSERGDISHVATEPLEWG